MKVEGRRQKEDNLPFCLLPSSFRLSLLHHHHFPHRARLEDRADGDDAALLGAGVDDAVLLDQVGGEDGEVVVERNGDTKQARACHGLTRALIANMVKGVAEGYMKELEILVVGFLLPARTQTPGAEDPALAAIRADLDRVREELAAMRGELRALRELLQRLAAPSQPPESGLPNTW